MIAPAHLTHSLVYFCVFVVLFPATTYVLVLEGGGSNLHSSITLISGAVVVLFSAFKLTALSRTCPDRMLATVFYLFTYIWIGLAPLYQLGTGAMPWRIVLPVEVYERAYLLTLLAIFSFEIAYGFIRPVRAGWAQKARPISLRALTIFGVCAGAVALYLGPITTPLSVLMSSREEAAAAFGETADGLIRTSLMRTPIYIALLAVLWKFRMDKENRVGLTGLLLVLLPIFVIVNFPTTVSRAWLGAIVVSIAVVFMLTANRRYWRYVPLSLCGGFLVVFPFMHRFRRAEFGWDVPLRDSILSSYSGGDFDVFAMTAHIVNFVSSYSDSVIPGRQLLGAMLFFVPRSNWADKPVGTGYHVAEQVGFGFWNISAPYWAEGFVNFGYAGVIVFMVVLAYALKKLDSMAAASQKLTGWHVFFAFLCGFLILIMRGDMFTVMGFTVPIAFSILALRVLR